MGASIKPAASPAAAFNRRNFLSALGGAAAVTAAPIPSAQAYDPGSEETRARYRETEDVKTFYRTNGYEGLEK